MTSCHKDEPKLVVSEENVQRVILVYAVNHSSLKYDFKNDSIEICKAMQSVDLNKFQVLVYKTVDRETTALYNFAYDNSGKQVFSKIKDYTRDVTSTDPVRIETVIGDALQKYPDATYDLIFWGHGTAWVPGVSDSNVYLAPTGPMKAYGGEYNGNTSASGAPVTSWTNLDMLASAVPDHTFDNIWFDCCYMSSIEVIYQFRNKCNTFIGYPTEVLSGGMAYNLVLPFLLRENPDEVGAAEAFFNFYDKRNEPVTVAVIDMKKLSPVVDATKNIIDSGFQLPAMSSMVNYSRMSSTMLVDFVTYFTWISDANGREDLSESLRNAFNDMCLYRAASSKDFRDRSWDLSKINCVSSYYFEDASDSKNDYYRSLDWYKTVFK